MKRRRKKTKRNARLRIAVLGMVALFLSVVYLATAEKLDPEQAIARLQSPPPDADLETLVKFAQKNPALHDWALVLQARALEERGESALEALEQLSKRPSAARVEGMLMYHRLRAEEGKGMERVENIAADFRGKYRRPDLEPEALYTVGLSQLAAKRDPEALTALEELRRRFPAHRFSKRARELSKEIRQRSPLIAAVALTESKLLASEGELEQARAFLQKARSLVGRDTPEYFESLFVEEALLRKEKAPEKADELLLSISAEAPPPFAAKASLQSAKNAWNENNHLHALELLDNFKGRFKTSELLTEVLYIEGRILEELGRYGDAERAYQATPPSAERVRALKRLLWLRYLRGDYPGVLKICDLIQSSTSAEKLDGLSDLLSAQYWRARALKELKQGEDAAQLFSDLTERDRRGYYGYLARKQLTALGKPARGYFQASSQPCASPDDLGEVKEQIEPLGKLNVLAQRELDYLFANLKAEVRDETLVETTTLHALWSERSGLPSSQVELAEEALKLIRLKNLSTECEPTLATLAFPVPFREEFIRNASKFQIQPTLSLALARTESFFRPDAESVVGALGLMQLMPATAKREGWDGKHPLTDPRVNIELGSKHLARLLGEFGGSTIKAAAAYNAGSAAVNRWIARYGNFPEELFVEFIGYPETNKYVRRVVTGEAIYGEILRRHN